MIQRQSHQKTVLSSVGENDNGAYGSVLDSWDGWESPMKDRGCGSAR